MTSETSQTSESTGSEKNQRSDSLNLESLNDLREIKGVGDKTARRLERFYGSEEDALKAIRGGDVASLSRVRGVTESKASQVVRNAVAQEYRDGNRNTGAGGGMLRSDTVREIYRDILKMIKDGASTGYGQAKLNLYFPVNSTQRIEEVRDWIREISDIDIRDEEKVENCLSEIEPPSPTSDIRVTDRVVVVGDPEKYEEAKQVFSNVPVELVRERTDVKGVIENYDRAILVDGSIELGDADHTYRPDALENPTEVVPEKVLGFYAENRSSILRSLDLVEEVDSYFGIDLSEEGIEELRDAVSRVNTDATVVGDEELEHLRNALERLDEAVAEAETKANQRLEKKIEEKEITIEGTDILSLVSKEGENRSFVRSELEDEFYNVIRDVNSELAEDLGLERSVDLFPRRIEYPVEVDDDAVERLRDELRREHSEVSLNQKLEVARQLEGKREPVERVVEDALELDVALAVKKFMDEHDAVLPEIGGEGFEIEGGRNLFIEDVVPVDYGVDSPTILSGVNSGGKTSTLDLIAQTYVLAHMGFPVPASHARIERLDSLHYYREIKKTMSSGAFESTLKQFREIVEEDGSKLVLVDELENITEPGAGARIVAGILESLREDDETAVFVSHLAENVREITEPAIPVDGIEAKGLNEDMELVVERTPRKNYVATSTPELVVEKLASRNDSEFYDELIEKFG